MSTMSNERDRLRKNIRLPPAAYREPGSPWLVTITTFDRRRYFGHDPSMAGAVLAMVTDDAPLRGLDLHLACLMPDHVHLLVTVADSDLVDAIGALKSRSTKVFRGFGGVGPLWQRSFHDQGIRNGRAFDDAVRYVLNNPVAAGIVEQWEEYDLIDGSWVADR